MLKEIHCEYLIDAIRVVKNESSYLHQKVTHNLVQEYRRLAKENLVVYGENGMEVQKPLHILTKRECQILQLLADGKSNRLVAETLYISEKTDRKSTRLNSSHVAISYAVFYLK